MGTAFTNEIWGATPTSNSRPAWVTEISDRCELAITPTVGCFTLGYMLAVPEEEIPCFGKLGSAELQRTEELIESYVHLMRDAVGEIIVAEHGAMSCVDKGAACIDHAHLHLIPMHGLLQEVENEYRKVGGPPNKYIERLSDLPGAVGNEPYILLATRFPECQVWLNVDKFPSQFVRRVCANLLGIPHRYNWRNYEFRDLMEFSAESLGAVIEGHRLFSRYNTLGANALSAEELRCLESALRKANPHIFLATETNIKKLMMIAGTRTCHAAEAAIDRIHMIWRAGALSQDCLPELLRLLGVIEKSPPHLNAKCAAREFLDDLNK